jgi:hypothetical protein
MSVGNTSHDAVGTLPPHYVYGLMSTGAQQFATTANSTAKIQNTYT